MSAKAWERPDCDPSLGDANIKLSKVDSVASAIHSLLNNSMSANWSKKTVDFVWMLIF